MASISALPNQVVSVATWVRGRRFFDQQAFPVYACILLLTAFACLAVQFFGYSWDQKFVGDFLLAFGTLTGFALLIRWTGFANLAGAMESSLLLLIVSTLSSITAFIAAGLDMPLRDAQFAMADRMLFGFDRTVLLHWDKTWPQAFALSTWIYDTLKTQPFILLGAFFLLRRPAMAWRFLLAWCFALMICCIVFPLTPAYGSPPYMLVWIDVFEGARNGTWRTIGLDVLTGIIHFPSFHAAGAVLLGWGGWQLPWLRWPMALLNAAMMVTAVLVGGHYIVDILAGTVVAVTAIWLATKVAPAAAPSDPAGQFAPDQRLQHDHPVLTSVEA